LRTCEDATTEPVVSGTAGASVNGPISGECVKCKKERDAARASVDDLKSLLDKANGDLAAAKSLGAKPCPSCDESKAELVKALAEVEALKKTLIEKDKTIASSIAKNQDQTVKADAVSSPVPVVAVNVSELEACLKRTQTLGEEVWKEQLSFFFFFFLLSSSFFRLLYFLGSHFDAQVERRFQSQERFGEVDGQASF
jgi:hypothetical protein